jgi:NTE family protein
VDAFNIVQDRITRTRLAADPPDTLIAPRLARFGVFDFHRADEAIKLGVEATEKALENIAEAMQALA